MYITEITEMERETDLIVFGASGFTGQYVALELARCSMKDKQRKWAIAGRSQAKLEKVLQMIQIDLGPDSTKDVDIIIADIKDDASLKSMCRKTKVVLNCVGPYRFYGEPVVKACVDEAANYVDVSGEPEFLEKMQLTYHDKAKAASVHIVGACGFDSIPFDCGLEFFKENFPGQLCQVESYINFFGKVKGHFGTYESIVHGVASSGSLKPTRQKLFPDRLAIAGPKIKKRGAIFFSKEQNKWTMPFMGADPSIARRTQYYQNKTFGEKPIQYGAYFCVPNMVHLIGVIFFGLFLAILTPFKFGRGLLLKFPKLFSFGTFSHEGPTRKEMDENSFSFTFYGRGYSKKTLSTGAETGEPDISLNATVFGPEAGYVATPIMMVQAALVIIDDKLPNKGGVLTPGSAFKGTSLVDRCNKHGVVFSIVPKGC